MKHILLTGSTGFIGRNITPILREQYDVASPTRNELDLLEADSVWRYLERRHFDAVIHLANPTAHNPIDKRDELFELTLRVFTSLLHYSDLYGKMIYLGSGAEYGKHRALSLVREDEFGLELPRDTYGLSRYIMSELACQKTNIINLRMFGCYGCGDFHTRLIPYVISCVSSNKTITLRQNTRFDYLYVKDITEVLSYFIENKPNYYAYNLCSGVPVFTGDIAGEVRLQMNSSIPMVFQSKDIGLDYIGDNSRLRKELQSWQPRVITDGIKEIIDYENRKV